MEKAGIAGFFSCFLCALVLWSATTSSVIAGCLSSVASERLSNYCLVDQAKRSSISLQTGKLIDYRLKKEGYARGLGLPGQVRSVTFQPFIAPVLQYEDDINGGEPNKPLMLGSLEFNGDPALVRKNGYVLGVNAGVSGRYILGSGRYVDYIGGLSYSDSPKYDIGIKRHNARVCSKNHIKNLWHLDGCASTSFEKKQLTEDRQHALSFSFSKLYKTPEFNFHQLNFGVNQVYKDDYMQNQFTVGLQTIHKNGWHSSLQSVVGETIENQHVTLSLISGSVSVPIRKTNVTFSASYRHASGGRLLGFDRTEDTLAVSAAFNIHKNIYLTVGYEETDSTISYFDSSSPTVSVNIAPLRF